MLPNNSHASPQLTNNSVNQPQPADAHWLEENDQLRLTLIKREEELRQLQRALVVRNSELAALHNLSPTQHLPKPAASEDADQQKKEVGIQADSSAQADPPEVPSARDAVIENLQKQLQDLESRTLMIQDEVQSVHTEIRQQNLTLNEKVRPQARVRIPMLGLVSHTPDCQEVRPLLDPNGISRGPQPKLWSEFLQWMQSHGISDMEQLRKFIVSHASKQFLRDLVLDIIDVEELPPETPVIIPATNSPGTYRRFSIISSVTDVPISNPRPLSDDCTPPRYYAKPSAEFSPDEQDHPPALSWEIAQYGNIAATGNEVAFAVPVAKSSEGSGSSHSPLVPPLPLSSMQATRAVPVRRRSFVRNDQARVRKTQSAGPGASEVRAERGARRFYAIDNEVENTCAEQCNSARQYYRHVLSPRSPHAEYSPRGHLSPRKHSVVPTGTTRVQYPSRAGSAVAIPSSSSSSRHAESPNHGRSAGNVTPRTLSRSSQPSQGQRKDHVLARRSAR